MKCILLIKYENYLKIIPIKFVFAKNKVKLNLLITNIYVIIYNNNFRIKKKT